MNNKLIFRKIKKKVKKIEKGQTEPNIRKRGGGSPDGIASNKRRSNINNGANTSGK